MRFGQPLYLFALLIIPILGVWLWQSQRQQRAKLASLGEKSLLAQLSTSVNWRGRRWRNRWWLIGLSFLIIALARPQWGTSAQIVRQDGIQIMVALDISRSMLAEDLKPNRLERAKQAISELMDRLVGDEVGLVLFSGASFIQFPLTSDYGTAKSFLSGANPQAISRPGTVIGEAIRTALTGFDDNRNSQKVIIVMTDGEDPDTNPIEAAQSAVEEGAILYTIGFGSPDGSPIPEFNRIGQLSGYKRDKSGGIVTSRLNETALEEIATNGKGLYYRATPSGEEIGSLVGELQKLQSAELSTRTETQAIERYQLFAALGLIALFIGELIPDRLRRINPSANGAAMRVLPLLVCGWWLVGCSVDTKGPEMLAAGNQSFEKGDYPQSVTQYTEARASGVQSAEPIYNIANSQYRQQQFGEAEKSLAQAVPTAEGTLVAYSYHNQGNALFAQGEYEKAIEAYKNALRINPNDTETKYNLELAEFKIATPTPTLTPTPTPTQPSEQNEDQPTPTPDSQQSTPTSEPTTTPNPTEEPSPEPTQEGDGGDEEATATPEATNPADSDSAETPTPDSIDPSQDGQEGTSTPTPQPDGSSADSEDGEETPTPSSAEQNQPLTNPGELSKEEALQLLNSIDQNAETLQEHLQKIFDSQLPPPDQDW